MQPFALILSSIFLYCYIILSSIEFGASVFNIYPELLGDHSKLNEYLSPVWETTNVFLVFFIVGIFTFFPGSVIYYGTNLMPLLFTALVFAVLRVVCMLLVFYGEIQNQYINLLFVISRFFFPLILCGFYFYCLTGQLAIIPESFLGLALWLFAIAVILLISATFFQYYSGVNLKKYIEKLAILFTLALAVLITALANSAPYLFANGYQNLLAGLVLLISAAGFIWIFYKQKFLHLFLSVCSIIGTIFFSLISLHLPYLIYPNVTVYSAFTDPAVFKIMMWCLPFGLIVVAPALFLLYSLFGSKQSHN